MPVLVFCLVQRDMLTYNIRAAVLFLLVYCIVMVTAKSAIGTFNTDIFYFSCQIRNKNILTIISSPDVLTINGKHFHIGPTQHFCTL